MPSVGLTVNWMTNGKRSWMYPLTIAWNAVSFDSGCLCSTTTTTYHETYVSLLLFQVTADEVLAKWVLELGSGVVWRPTEANEVARTLPFARYFLPVEWMTVSDATNAAP